MTTDHKENLFRLVKSLSKSEKRQFKLYAGRVEANQNAKFLHLFNYFGSCTSTYDERGNSQEKFCHQATALESQGASVPPGFGELAIESLHSKCPNANQGTIGFCHRFIPKRLLQAKS